MGLGLPLGAFLAGLVVSESDFAHEVFTQVRPLRDVFAALFFVSVGMLLDPRFVLAHWPQVTAVVLTILIGKALVTMIALRLLGWNGRTVVLTSLGLAQIGEFSFVLATMGAAKGLVGEEVAGVILASALISILLAPFVFGGAGRVYSGAMRLPLLAPLLTQPPAHEANGKELQEDAETCAGDAARVIVLGAGRVGRYLSDALRATNVSHVVIDFDGSATVRLRENGARIIYGDATSEAVLAQTKPHCAELGVIALSEAETAEIALRLLKRLAPELPVVVRVRRGVDIPRMRAAGADAVVHAEFEAGTEVIRQGLDRLGLPDPVVDAYIKTVREKRYRQNEA